MSFIVKEKPVALITGGSSGIGFELSKLFAMSDYNLVWVALLDDELSEAKEKITQLYGGVEVKYIALDLSEIGAAQKVYDWVKSEEVEVEVLVNSAGFGMCGFMNDLSPERELSMIQLNVITLHQLTRLYLADMVAADKGKILNIASTAGLSPIPFISTYAATKAFVKHFSEGLSYELESKNSAVSVTTVCPPPVRTGFQAAANMEESELFEHFLAMDAKDVAYDAFEALMRSKSLVFPGLVTNLFVKAMQFIPNKQRMTMLSNIL